MRRRMILVTALALGACHPCVTRSLPNANGESHRISPYLLVQHGCPSFDGVTTAEEMTAWCQAHQLGDAAIADVLPECARDHPLSQCEWFWVCE